MAKLRHIAFYTEDPEASAKFFENAFDMKIIRRTERSRSLTDGVFNVTIIKALAEEGNKPGLHHFGMWVDDIEAAEKQAAEAGAEKHAGPPLANMGYYEVKYTSPDGLIFDLTHTGWPGAVKDPATEGEVDLEAEEPAGAAE